MISINSTIADRIARYISEPYIVRTKEVYSDDKSKEELISLFQKCLSFKIEDGQISFVMNRSQSEIDEQLVSFKNVKKHTLIQLKKNYADEKYTDMITTYLKHKKLDYVLDDLNITEQ